MARYSTRGVGYHRNNYGPLKARHRPKSSLLGSTWRAEGAQVQQRQLEVKWSACNLLQLLRLALHRRLEQRRVCHLSNRASEAQHSHTNYVKPEHCTTEYCRTLPRPKEATPKRPTHIPTKQGSLARRNVAGSLERRCRFEPWRGRWPCAGWGTMQGCTHGATQLTRTAWRPSRFCRTRRSKETQAGPKVSRSHSPK